MLRVATNLVKAFDEAKALAYRHAANPRSIPLAWVRTAWEEQLDVLGADPWAYGLGDANRKNVQTVLRYCHQQGLIGGMMPFGELFADTDLGGAGGGADNISFEMSWVWAGLA
jgi:4,5-dihydroxyphthalate decarboxylase